LRRRGACLPCQKRCLYSPGREHRRSAPECLPLCLLLRPKPPEACDLVAGLIDALPHSISCASFPLTHRSECRGPRFNTNTLVLAPRSLPFSLVVAEATPFELRFTLHLPPLPKQRLWMKVALPSAVPRRVRIPTMRPRFPVITQFFLGGDAFPRSAVLPLSPMPELQDTDSVAFTTTEAAASTQRSASFPVAEAMGSRQFLCPDLSLQPTRQVPSRARPLSTMTRRPRFPVGGLARICAFALSLTRSCVSRLTGATRDSPETHQTNVCSSLIWFSKKSPRSHQRLICPSGRFRSTPGGASFSRSRADSAPEGFPFPATRRLRLPVLLAPSGSEELSGTRSVDISKDAHRAHLRAPIPDCPVDATPEGVAEDGQASRVPKDPCRQGLPSRENQP
jgi:hypothetical protein